MPALLQVNQVSYHHPQAHSDYAIRRVTFAVQPKQICAVVGASGSGKTTLLRLISGTLEPEQGTIYLSGQRVTGPSQNLVPGHPDIRTVFQDFALEPNLSVYHNIAHPLRAYRPDYRKHRTHELIERLALSGLENQRPASLSGGEKQRVALARALAEEPVLLLLDEPFSQVDPPLKNRLMNEVVDILQETAGTALFVTHDARDALAWSNQVVVLQGGEMVQQGTPPQIYEQPVNSYVAQLMGECSLIPTEKFCRWFPHYAARGATWIGIRPEHVSVSSDPERGIKGKVVRSNYRGAYYAILVRLGDGTELLVYHPDLLTIDAVITVFVQLDKVLPLSEKIGDTL
jgi:iron(III) transport system ATP-binding protein